ncbi:MAG: BtrH N-terminal domain-containing protein [Myxococcaceae bacterium]|nr:BtrH N-terminal domain-containing protein [Myxococcaceae bacterium]
MTAFTHQLAAHCESGVTASLLTHAGLQLSEPRALGIGSGLFFVQLPMDGLMGAPSTSFRSKPGNIFWKVTRRLGVPTRVQRYRDPRRAHDELLRLVDAGQLVALQTSVYFLEYLPRRFRFPFNAHNIIIYGRKNGRWLVSDPVLDQAAECDDESLSRARFAAGLLAPRGKAYWVERIPDGTASRVNEAMAAGLRETGFTMGHSPIPFFGAKAIGYLAKRCEAWPKRFAKEPQKALLLLANVVRMQEEIGTGGAGFRYLYAAFLQDVADTFGDSEYARLSERVTAIGDTWRKFAGAAARLFRGGQATPELFAPVVELLRGLSTAERTLFRELSAHGRGGRKALPAVASPT